MKFQEGQRFDRLTVIQGGQPWTRYAPGDGNRRQTKIKCRCDCGAVVFKASYTLLARGEKGLYKSVLACEACVKQQVKPLRSMHAFGGSFAP